MCEQLDKSHYAITVNQCKSKNFHIYFTSHVRLILEYICVKHNSKDQNVVQGAKTYFKIYLYQFDIVHNYDRQTYGKK